MSDGILIVGVGGGTGAGKSTVVEGVVSALGEAGVVVVEHDWYYRDVRGLSAAERDAMNYDHPDSLETDLLVRNLEELCAGREVCPPVYDYATHTRKGSRAPIAPRAVIIVEGILVLACEALREMLDVKVYVDAAEETRLKRRVDRDAAERGRGEEAVRKQYAETVAPMHREFVEPSRAHADIVVDGEDTSAAVEAILSLLRARAGVDKS